MRDEKAAGAIATGGRSAARRIVADALCLDEAEVGDGDTMATLPAWDSLAHLRLVLAIETRLGRTLAPEAVVAIDGVADVAAILEAEDGANGGAAAVAVRF